MHTPRMNLVATLVYAMFLFISSNGPTQAEEKRGAFSGGVITEYPSWFKSSFLNFSDDIAEAKSHGKRVMLLFTQEGCPYCNALVERNLAQKDIEEMMRKNFDVIAVNMWGDREVTGLDAKTYTEKSFAASQKVQFTPTILFFDESGKMILRLNGYLPPPKFKTALEFIAQHKEKEISYRDYVAANQPPPSSGELAKEDFFVPAPYNLARKPAGKAKPLAVFFEQKDCPSCVELHSKILPEPDTRALIKQFHAIQLDMWSHTPVVTPQGKHLTAREWAKALDIKYAPTVVLFDAQGKEIIRSEAFFKVFHTQGIFAYVAEGAYKTEPSFQRFLSARAENFREQGKDVDIWRLADEPEGKK
jgi:thioredoxin-related protein